MSKLISPLRASLIGNLTSAVLVTLIMLYWTLCVGVGRRNSLVNFHCSRLPLWVSCIRGRQNSFSCWVSPGHKKWYSAAWNCSGSKLLPTESNGPTSPFVLTLFKGWACRVYAGSTPYGCSTKQTQHESVSQGMRVAPNWFWSLCGAGNSPWICLSGRKDCIASMSKCINLFLKALE